MKVLGDTSALTVIPAKAGMTSKSVQVEETPCVTH
jgi:hypothetical protein